MIRFSRRQFALALPLLLGGCVSDLPPQGGLAGLVGGDEETNGGNYASIYRGFQDGRFPVPAIDLSRIDPRFYRQRVAEPTGQPPGTGVVDPDAHFLYFVEGDGKAMRYGVGVGRQGFEWHGNANIKRKAIWPTWTPPSYMVARDEKAAAWAKGMPGGPGNPLGARALYLFQGDRDTLYRLHGTIEPESIGKSMSSGCIRLLNQDIIDLYNRVSIGTRVVVLSSQGAGETYAEASPDVFEPRGRPVPMSQGDAPSYGYDPYDNGDDGPQ